MHQQVRIMFIVAAVIDVKVEPEPGDAAVRDVEAPASYEIEPETVRSPRMPHTQRGPFGLPEHTEVR